MWFLTRSTRLRRTTVLAWGALLSAVAAVSPLAADVSGPACVTGDRMLRVGFYAFFDPVSYSADLRPQAPGFDVHLGYEANLLTALEAIPGAGLAFSRSGIAQWDGIWLRAADDRYDVVGGGITILDSRTRNAAGQPVVLFTAGHIAFRQSLLVRAEDAARLARHADLTSDVRVGVLAGSTGESRLLELTGLADSDGVLARGTLIATDTESLLADGSATYSVGAAGTSPALRTRRRLFPPSDAQPQVFYLGDDAGEQELIKALRSGLVDALARGEVGNLHAASESGGAFAVTALDYQVEHGGFTLAAPDAALAACLDLMIDWLTDNRSIGYRQWIHDPDIFLRRARAWRP